MQTKIYKAYKGMPVEIKVTAPRFIDYKNIKTLEADTEITFSLSPYSGLDSNSQSTWNIFSFSGKLPDLTEFPEATGVLKPYGYVYLTDSNVKYDGLLATGLVDTGQQIVYNLFYNNGALMADVVEEKEGWLWVGSFTAYPHTPLQFYQINYLELGALTYEMPYVSGFSAAKYLVSFANMPTQQYFPPTLRIISRVVSGSSVSSVQSIFWDDSANNHGIGINGGKWRIYGSSGRTGGTVAVNTSYWIMFIQDVYEGSKFYFMLDDGTYTEETLPLDVAEWTLAVTSTGTIFDANGAKLRIGTGYGSPSEFWKGKIDLVSTRVDYGIKPFAESSEVTWNEYWRPLVFM